VALYRHLCAYPPIFRFQQLGGGDIPFAFGTGYGEALTLTGIMSEVPIIAKPYHRSVLAEFLKRFLPARDSQYTTLIDVQA
jgi:hypothetical protein